MIIGVGIDLVDVKQFRDKLNDELVQELFLTDEIEYCRSQVRFWENFSARFAAKEAVFKALGHGLSSGLRFRDVEVVRRTDTGAVSIKLHGKALKEAEKLGIVKLPLSISHTRECAIAIVIAEGSETV